MLSFSKQEDYSLIILSKLTKNYKKRFISLSKIAGEYDISILFLRNLARDLRRAGIIKAKEGKNGGYFLERDPKEIKIKEVLNVFSQKPVLECLSKNHNCSKKSFCETSNSWRKVSIEFIRKIENFSLYDFLNYK